MFNLNVFEFTRGKGDMATLVINPSVGPPMCQALLGVPLLSLHSSSVSKALLSSLLQLEETEAWRGLMTSPKLPCQSGQGPTLSPSSCQVQLQAKLKIHLRFV